MRDEMREKAPQNNTERVAGPRNAPPKITPIVKTKKLDS